MRALTPAETWTAIALLLLLVAIVWTLGFITGVEHAQRKAHRRVRRRISRAMRALERGGRS